MALWLWNIVLSILVFIEWRGIYSASTRALKGRDQSTLDQNLQVDMWRLWTVLF